MANETKQEKIQRLLRRTTKPGTLVGNLTPKQRMFVQFYLNEAKFNACRAALMAGYKDPADAACKAMKHPLIRYCIAHTIDQVCGSNEILTRVSSRAKADMSDIAECYKTVEETIGVDKNGNAIHVSVNRIDWAMIRERDYGPLIKKVTPTKNGDVIELYDAHAADELLGKRLRLWVDKMELDIAKPLDQMNDDELAAVVAKFSKGGKL